MAHTIDVLGSHNAPVISSASRRALDNSVVHLLGISYSWSGGDQGKVCLVSHRLGYQGTGSSHIFYRLNKAGRGRRGHPQ